MLIYLIKKFLCKIGFHKWSANHNGFRICYLCHAIDKGTPRNKPSDCRSILQCLNDGLAERHEHVAPLKTIPITWKKYIRTGPTGDDLKLYDEKHGRIPVECIYEE